MPAFNRQESKALAIKIKIRRAKLMSQHNPWYKLKHVGEARDGAKGQWTLLEKRITDETKAQQLRNETFRRKLHDTD